MGWGVGESDFESFLHVSFTQTRFFAFPTSVSEAFLTAPWLIDDRASSHNLNSSGFKQSCFAGELRDTNYQVIDNAGTTFSIFVECLILHVWLILVKAVPGLHVCQYILCYLGCLRTQLGSIPRKARWQARDSALLVACPSSDIDINRLFVVVLMYSAFAIPTEFAFSQHTYTVDFQALCECIELQILHVWKLSMPNFLGTNWWGLNLWDSMGTPAVMASVLVLWLSEEDTWATIWLYSYSVFSDSTSTNNSNYNSNSLNLNQVQHGTTNSTTCWCVLYRFDSFRSF